MTAAVGARVVELPTNGVWRVGRGDDPLRLPDSHGMSLEDTRVGNRFDSYSGAFSVLYFGTTLEACFGETLARYRRDPALAFIEDEWAHLGFMDYGAVPRDWRTRRTAVRVKISGVPSELFFNIENPSNHRLIQRELAAMLAVFGYADVDIPLVRGHDRRVTRLVSEWVWGQRDEDGVAMFAGIRYLSRLHTDWECWALFDDADITELERQPILQSTTGLSKAALLHGLVVH